MANLAEHLAAGSSYGSAGVALKCVTKRVVGGEEEPGVATGLHQRLAGAVGEHPGVVGPVDGVGVALRTGEVRRGRPRYDEDPVLLPGDLADRERDAGIRRIDDQVDLVDVVPLVGE